MCQVIRSYWVNSELCSPSLLSSNESFVELAGAADVMNRIIKQKQTQQIDMEIMET